MKTHKHSDMTVIIRCFYIVVKYICGFKKKPINKIL